MHELARCRDATRLDLEPLTEFKPIPTTCSRKHTDIAGGLCSVSFLSAKNGAGGSRETNLTGETRIRSILGRWGDIAFPSWEIKSYQRGLKREKIK